MIFLKEKYSLTLSYRLYYKLLYALIIYYNCLYMNIKYIMCYFICNYFFFQEPKHKRSCQSKAEDMLGSTDANPRLWPLHKHDIWLLVRSVALIKSEHLRSEPQPDHNVLPRGDSAGGDINNKQGTQGPEWEVCVSLLPHPISLLKSFTRFINWCALTCCWLLLIMISYSSLF